MLSSLWVKELLMSSFGWITVSGISNALFLSMIVGIPFYGITHKVKVYESFLEGAKEGFDVVIKIIPFLVGMLVAIGMLRASGAFDSIAALLSPSLQFIGVPAEIIPISLVRPFSGAASNAMLVDMISTYGPDALVSRIGGTIMGSTETTFFVVAVYFGAVNIKKVRHAVAAGLLADFVGILAAVYICQWLLG
ncbi:MAG TPA: spore maturation protein [Gammaproteobacteria bacterium]|nr:spore maturation protein [Gammaproteobacteria bacterium]